VYAHVRMRLTLSTLLLIASACSEGGRSTDGSESSEVQPAPAPLPAATSTLEATSIDETLADGTAFTSRESPDDSTNETPSAPMRGAVSLHVEPLGDCSLGDAWIDYPVVDGGHPVTATEHETLSEDNGPGIPGRPLHVTCEWLTSGTPYRLVLGINAYVDGSSRSASLNPVLEASQSNTGAFSFSTVGGGPAWGPLDATKLCEYTLIEMDESKQSIWGRITCPSLRYQNGTENCQITEGYFYFENCRPRML
jgi:hypothetical protein